MTPTSLEHMVTHTASHVSTTDNELKNIVVTMLVLSSVHLGYCDETSYAETSSIGDSGDWAITFLAIPVVVPPTPS